MKPKDIKAGHRCTVGWFSSGGHMGYRKDYTAEGRVVFRRGGRIKFQWESGDTMDCDFIATPKHSTEFFWVNLLDLRTIEGLTLKEWESATTLEPATP